MLVLATQTCTLKNAHDEPMVEFRRAYWTDKKSVIASAKPNSNRACILRKETIDGVEKALIAEAGGPICVEKSSLLQIAPEPGCCDERSELRFKKLLARRYDRVALPQPVVQAIQQPVVDTLKHTPEEHEIWTLLDGVGEVLFDTDEVASPFKVRLMLLRGEELTDAPPITDADAEKVVAFFMAAISAQGEAEVESWEAADTTEVSLRRYAEYTALPLDHYSL